MYQQLASRLAVDTNNHYSQPVSMQRANNVFVETMVYEVTGSGNLTISVEQSNDLENWDQLSDEISETTVTPGFYISANAGEKTGAAYVRLKYTMSAGSSCILAAGLNTSSQ